MSERTKIEWKRNKDEWRYEVRSLSKVWEKQTGTNEEAQRIKKRWKKSRK